MPLTLISSTPSAFARINRIALIEKGIEFNLQTEVPWDSDTETPNHNPLEKLPILIFEDGSSIYDSAYIQEYIVEMYADQGPPLLPTGKSAIFQAKQIQVLAEGQMDAMVLRSMERRREHSSKEWLARQERKINGATKAYSEYVKAADGGWLVGNTYSIADIAVGCALGWVEYFDICQGWKEQYPELAAWWEKLSRRESFQQTVPVMFTIKDKIV